MKNVASVNVAHVILTIDGVADRGVVGLPHEQWTECGTGSPVNPLAVS